ISGKMTVSRRATSGRSRRVSTAFSVFSALFSVDLDFGDCGAIKISCCDAPAAPTTRWMRRSTSLPCSIWVAGWSKLTGSTAARSRLGGLLCSVGCFSCSDALVVEGFQDPRPQALLELEEDPDPCEIDASLLGEVPNPEDSTDIVFAIQPDVRRGP